MQIQRLQSLYLLISAIFTGVFCLFPYAVATVETGESIKMMVSDTPVLLILNLTTAILLLITIFMYGNLKQQMKVTAVDIALIIGSIITTLIYVFATGAHTVPLTYGGLTLLVVAECFAIAAYRRMKHDQRLLSSADRLR